MQLKHALMAGLAAVTVGAAAVAVAGPGSGVVTLYGGGATFPAVAYVGDSYSQTGQRRTSPPDAGSVFDQYVSTTTGVNVSYCQTGSGAGKRGMTGQTPLITADGTCPSFGSITPVSGFGAPSSPTGVMDDDPNFGGTDSPLTQTEFDAAKTNKGGQHNGGLPHTQITQFPTIAGAVGISFNHPDASSLDLSTAQLCGVFAGTITTWSALGVTPTGGNPTGITVRVRSDGSGTTFSLSNHLVAACNPLGFAFTRTQNPYINNVVVPAAGSTFVAHSGNFGVASAVRANPGSIGYGDLGDGKAQVPELPFATVNGFSPENDLASPNVTLQVDPHTGAVVPGCVIQADPASYANPSGSYPIIAVTYLMGYATGNAVAARPLQELFLASVNPTLNTVDHPGYVTLSTAARAAISDAIPRCTLP